MHRKFRTCTAMCSAPKPEKASVESKETTQSVEGVVDVVPIAKTRA